MLQPLLACISPFAFRISWFCVLGARGVDMFRCHAIGGKLSITDGGVVAREREGGLMIDRGASPPPLVPLNLFSSCIGLGNRLRRVVDPLVAPLCAAASPCLDPPVPNGFFLFPWTPTLSKLFANRRRRRSAPRLQTCLPPRTPPPRHPSPPGPEGRPRRPKSQLRKRPPPPSRPIT